MSGTWRTKQGEMLEIKWMDSVHLAHSLNLVLNTLINGTALLARSPAEKYKWAVDRSELYAELNSRKLATFRLDEGKFEPPATRETPLQMCMLRAILETDNGHALNVWNNDREYTFDLIAGPNRTGYWEPVYFKFAQYRLQRA